MAVQTARPVARTVVDGRACGAWTAASAPARPLRENCLQDRLERYEG